MLHLSWIGIFRFQHCLSNFLIHLISSSSLLDLFFGGGGCDYSIIQIFKAVISDRVLLAGDT